ncbi:MAG: hypothetical protein P8170_08395 [Gemmatimonadota bacterium]
MGPSTALVLNDLRGVRRDRVLSATVTLSLLATTVITVLGVFQDRLDGWSAWFPLVVALSLVGGPGGFGFLWGLLWVDEGDTGVRDALAVTPVPPTRLLFVRTVTATGWTTAWPLASVYLMNSTWQAVDLPLSHWLAVIIPLALFTPSFALLIPTVADDKVGALAVFKALSFLTLAPLALFFMPTDAVYRPLLLISPTGCFVEAYQAFLRHLPEQGALWSVGATVYALLLLAIVVHRFRTKIYRLHR